jgi:hypothetical protein
VLVSALGTSAGILTRALASSMILLISLRFAMSETQGGSQPRS